MRDMRTLGGAAVGLDMIHRASIIVHRMIARTACNVRVAVSCCCDLLCWCGSRCLRTKRSLVVRRPTERCAGGCADGEACLSPYTACPIHAGSTSSHQGPAVKAMGIASTSQCPPRRRYRAEHAPPLPYRPTSADLQKTARAAASPSSRPREIFSLAEAAGNGCQRTTTRVQDPLPAAYCSRRASRSPDP